MATRRRAAEGNVLIVTQSLRNGRVCWYFTYRRHGYLRRDYTHRPHDVLDLIWRWDGPVKCRKAGTRS